MKKVGFVFISIGIALLIFAIYSFITSSSQTLSPIPENKGVKVILISPTQTK
jgi:hypothetical protein